MLKAEFTVAAWYEVSAECLTPIRTGGADNDPETLLLTKRLTPVRTDGNAADAETVFMNAQPVLLLQGSSLAGALRGWLEENGENADALFGSSAVGGQIRPGRLRVSDGVFLPETETTLRPRLKLNPKTHAAENDKKFDMAHIQTGARFDFRLIWLGTEETQKGELATIERMLSALHNGEIRLGAQKSNGFGRVSLRYRKRVYILSKENDRREWLNQSPPDGVPITPEALTDSRRVQFILRFRADSLLVKAGAEAFAEEDGKPSMVTVSIEEAGYAVIPGSSVKGAVRARAEQIAVLKGLPVGETESLFGRMARGGNDNGLAGVARFEDIRLSNEKRVRVKRIRINRFTGGVVTSGLFTEEPVSTSVPAELRVSLPANRERGCALLLYALRDLAWNLYGLGSGRSIGRGTLDASELEIRLPGGGTALFRFRDGFRCEASGEVETVQGWLTGLEAKRT
ncbi:MAG: hypothetical protein IJQ81_06970 [Oscillibacter sp.]|nr:hypothetical protein [Oscillibacter sp.]